MRHEARAPLHSCPVLQAACLKWKASTMTDRPREYQSYLLRLWRTGAGEAIAWRASVEDIRTGQWHSFASLSAAFRFLDHQTEQLSGSQEGGSGPPHLSMTEQSD